MAKLKKAGLVATRSGSVGGYQPLVPPGKLTLDRVADALEVRFVEPAWHSGGTDMPCMVASGMAGVMDGLFDDLDRRCRARLASSPWRIWRRSWPGPPAERRVTMGFDLEVSVPALTVFVQGLLSFFSPCVLPLVPLYVSYLAGGTGTVGEDGVIRYPRKKVLVNTIFFVLGVSFAFFLLGFGFTALGRFFSDYQTWFARISGVIMVLFGVYQFGFFGKAAALEREHRLPFRLDKWAMNPVTALVLGFTFSFAWTPCVGPPWAACCSWPPPRPRRGWASSSSGCTPPASSSPSWRWACLPGRCWASSSGTRRWCATP